MTISLLLVDDHPVFLFGLRTLIAEEPDLQILGEAQSGAEALQFLVSQPVDVVIMDIKLPDINGVEVTRRVRKEFPHARILILSMLDDNTVFNALRAGAHGYILKGAGGEETLRAIRAVANGESIFSPSIARRMMTHFDQSQPHELFPELTDREREILSLLASGLTNTAIAERLSLSVKTVRNRVSDIFSKLHVHDRAEAILKARDAGLE
jgi:DNA-binding NarL/FixJ family response regulator